MTELLQLALNDFNLPITILLGCMALFWIVSALGAIDVDTVDVALGLDTDVDVDIDVDIETSHELDVDAEAADQSGHGASSALQALLRFLGAADAPIMFALTIYVLMLWCSNMVGNHYFNPTDSSAIATIVLGSSLVSAFVLTRLTIQPLKPILKLFSGKETQIPVLGRSGTVRAGSISESDTGQVEAEGGLLLIARAATGTGTLSKGDSVVVIEKEDDSTRDVYIVRGV